MTEAILLELPIKSKTFPNFC